VKNLSLIFDPVQIIKIIFAFLLLGAAKEFPPSQVFHNMILAAECTVVCFLLRALPRDRWLKISITISIFQARIRGFAKHIEAQPKSKCL